MNRGQWNFDEIRFDYYRDETVALRELQGRQSRLSTRRRAPRTGPRPTTSPRCATDGSSARRCRSSARSRCSASCSICAGRNSRTAACARPSTSPSTSSGPTRICSTASMPGSAAIFEGTELAAPPAPPQGRELEILNEVKDQVPPEVFTDGAQEPGQRHAGRLRATICARPSLLLKEAGYEVKDGVLVNAKTGQPLDGRVPAGPAAVRAHRAALYRAISSGSASRRASAWSTAPNIRGGSTASTTTSSSAISPSRIRRATSSAISGARRLPAAKAASNLIGIKDPAIDKLVDHVIFAKDRDELVAATNALDRVLLWNDFVVPQWYAPKVRIAYWDRYGQPRPCLR